MTVLDECVAAEGRVREPVIERAAGAEPRRRRVLMISAAFPPAGGPGVQRSVKFAKYLPEFGWDPIVWAAEGMDDLPYDASLLNDVPASVRVYRRGFFDPRRLSQRFFRADHGVRPRINWRCERLLTAAMKRMVPDHLGFWALHSAAECRRLIKQEVIDAVYSTFSPASNHLLGWLLHRSTGLPWVADFRDLWTDDYCYPFGDGLRKRIDRRIEQVFIDAADRVIGVTESQTQTLRARAATRPDKFVTITNGYDETDFAAIDPAEARARLHGPEDRLMLAFTGWFLSDRIDPALIEGMSRFGRSLGGAAGRFEFRVVGSIGRGTARVFRNAGVNVTTTGYVPHDRAIAQMIAADALLLLGPTSARGANLLPGKAFEYLASGRPILAIGPGGDSEIRRLIESCNAGMFLEADADAVATGLSHLWHQFDTGKPLDGAQPRVAIRAATVRERTTGATSRQSIARADSADDPSATSIAQFTRRHLAGHLAVVLNDLCRIPV